MGFVFVLRRPAQRGRANQLAKALKARGLDVCVGLENEPPEIQSSVSRCLIDNCKVMAALWSEADLADPAFIEPMRYAAAGGKLLAMSLEGAFLPASFSDASQAPNGWTSNRSTFDEVCEAIAEKGRQSSDPNEWAAANAFTASEEYAAYVRMHKQGGVEAIARFLREFAGGMLEDIARSELDAATRPTYEPAATGRGWSLPKGDEAREPASVWRMESGSAAEALERLDPRWLWAAGGALALAGLAAAVVLVGPRIPLDLRPRMADADLAELSEPARIETPSPTEMAEMAADPIDAAIQADPGASAPEVQPPASREPMTERAALDRSPPAVEVVRQEPPPTVSAPTPRVIEAATDAGPSALPVSTPRAYDIAQLDPALRDFVERARRNEARALVEALRRGGAQNATSIAARSAAGSGVYRGEWSNGAANGLGRAVWANGDTYAGAWGASRPDGLGVLGIAGGLRYEGEFADGAPTGRGVFWGPDGRPLSGDRLASALVSARSR